MEKALAVVRPEEHGVTRRPDRGFSACTGLVAQLFGPDEQRRVVAFASTRPGEGVTSIVQRLADEVSRWAGVQCSVVTAADLLAASGQRNAVVRSPGGFSGSPARVGALTVESDYVLVDGGSIEAGDILGLAANVDAIVLVVEAGKTRSRALAEAIAAISNAGGTVTGLVLNRRTRALPAWLERLLD